MALYQTSLDGRVALVTGAGRGFGAQIASDLAELGATVVLADVDAVGAAHEASVITGHGGRAISVVCDVADIAGLRVTASEVRSSVGSVDILVNNAGIASFRRFIETSQEEWERVFAVNFTGMFNTCHVFVPEMLERGSGCIVNLSSIAGKRGGGFLGTAAYATAKAGVIGLTSALAADLAPAGIRVNCVAPGAMDTEMTAALRSNPELLSKVLAGIPLGARGTIRDVADAVVFLCTDEASGIVGETLNIDGGVMME